MAPDNWVKLEDLGVAPGVSVYLEGVKVTKNKGFNPANIAGKWKRKYRGWSVEEAWLRREPQRSTERSRRSPNGLF